MLLCQKKKTINIQNSNNNESNVFWGKKAELADKANGYIPKTITQTKTKILKKDFKQLYIAC